MTAEGKLEGARVSLDSANAQTWTRIAQRSLIPRCRDLWDATAISSYT